MKKIICYITSVRKQYLLYILFICLIALFSKTVIGQVEMLVGGNMENEAAWNISHLDSEEQAFYQFNSTTSLAAGEGNSLMIWADGLATSNFLIWQPVDLKANTVYLIDGAFKDLTGGLLTNFWCEILIGAEAPVDGEDYGPWAVVGFNTWLECGNNVDGTFVIDGCRNNAPRYFMPDSLGDEATMYYCINVGMWTDGDAHPYTIAIDEVSMIDSAAIPNSILENKDINEKELLFVYSDLLEKTASIDYIVPETANVELSVYNLLGEKVIPLVSDIKEKGKYNINYNVANLNSNIYVCRLKVNDIVVTKKLFIQ